MASSSICRGEIISRETFPLTRNVQLLTDREDAISWKKGPRGPEVARNRFLQIDFKLIRAAQSPNLRRSKNEQILSAHSDYVIYSSICDYDNYRIYASQFKNIERRTQRFIWTSENMATKKWMENTRLVPNQQRNHKTLGKNIFISQHSFLLVTVFPAMSSSFNTLFIVRTVEILKQTLTADSSSSLLTNISSMRHFFKFVKRQLSQGTKSGKQGARGSNSNLNSLIFAFVIMDV